MSRRGAGLINGRWNRWFKLRRAGARGVAAGINGRERPCSPAQRAWVRSGSAPPPCLTVGQTQGMRTDESICVAGGKGTTRTLNNRASQRRATHPAPITTVGSGFDPLLVFVQAHRRQQGRTYQHRNAGQQNQYGFHNEQLHSQDFVSCSLTTLL